MLETLGFSPVEAALYELLVTHGRMTLDEVLAQSEVEPERQRRALNALVAKGLVRQLAAPAHEYVVAPPEQAIEVLIAEQMSALRAVRARSAELAARVRRVTQHADPTELIEVVSGDGAARQLFLQVVKTAREELAIFDRPPYAASPTEGLEEQAERMTADRLRLRTVFDRSLLEDPVHVRRMLAGIANGEQGRVATVPIKLAIIDREWGMLPLVHADGVTPEAVVIVRKSVLLDSMLALFESVWQNAAEIRPQTDDELTLLTTDEADLRQVAHLMAVGMTDLAIARHLGISERTVRRRIKDLMNELRVDSRFLAGVRAAQRGWV